MSVELWKSRNILKAAIRDFFGHQEYLEVDTPIAVPCPGTERYLDYFATSWVDHHDRPHSLWLRSSPELHMKQIMAKGATKIFQISNCFRNNGELSKWHHPEFTMLEWYEANFSWPAFMEQTLSLLRETYEYVSRHLPTDPKLNISTFRYITLKEAFWEFAGLELIDEDPELASKAKDKGIVSVQPGEDFDTAFFKILLEKIEPEIEKLGSVVLHDYPASQAALARIEDGVARRFEVYVRGIELSNGFFELIDAKENKKRVQETNTFRQGIGKAVTLEDEHFYQALHQVPPCCGNALGFDRWLALILGHHNLDKVVPFRAQAPFIPEAHY